MFTLGSRGAAIYDGTLTCLPASAADVVDTTAAGDAFNGALASGIADGKELAEAVRYAIVTAGLAVSKTGAQPSLPSRTQVETRFAQP